jgi:hypothetical protein
LVVESKYISPLVGDAGVALGVKCKTSLIFTSPSTSKVAVGALFPLPIPTFPVVLYKLSA